MSYVLIQPVLVLISILLLIIIISIIKAKFNFKLKNQDKWLTGLIIILSLTIASSVLNYTKEWKFIFDHLQVFTLSTLFSAIAAIGVIIQISRAPYIFTSINPTLNLKDLGLQISENVETKITLYIRNCSKITGKGIYVRGQFPSEVKVLSVNTPTWSKTEANTFDVNLDAKGYNPLHPFVHTTLEIKIKAEKIESYKTVKLSTMAKNMEMNLQTFLIKTKNFNDEGMYIIEELEDNEKNNIINLSFKNERQKYFSLQKIMTFIVLILGLFSWIEPLMYYILSSI